MLKELVRNRVYYKIFEKIYPEQIKKDAGIILKNFDASNILLLNQVHGNSVICPDDEANYDFAIQRDADALVTAKQNIILGIMTADCVPLLLASENGDVIGAAHCGWRGSKLNIIDNVVAKMKNLGAANIVAVIGPSIAQSSYEVSSDYYDDFIAESSSYQRFFTQSPKNDHYMFDLPAFVKQKLQDAKVKLVTHINEDTYSMADKYPSYRRHIHTKESYEQKTLSAIMIR